MDAKVTTDEIVGTLVSQMRGDLSLLLNAQGEFDLAIAKERRLTHLIKKYKTKTRHISVKGSEPEKEITVEIELHDSQMAAKHLCTVFGIERLPAPNPETIKALDAAIQRFVERAAERGIEVTAEDARARLVPYFESQSVS